MVLYYFLAWYSIHFVYMWYTLTNMYRIPTSSFSQFCIEIITSPKTTFEGFCVALVAAPIAFYQAPFECFGYIHHYISNR